MITIAGFVGNLQDMAMTNDDFRRVVFTAPHSQLVLMCLRPHEEIGTEVHDVDQLFRIEGGHGVVIVGGAAHQVGPGAGIVVPAGTEHNVVNESSTDCLRLTTVYSPPVHRDGIVHRTRAEALADEEDHR